MMGSFPTVYLQNNSSPGKETPKPCLPTFPSLQPRKHPSTLCTLPARRRPAPGAPPPGPHPHPAPSLAPMACEPHLEGGVPPTPAWRRVLTAIFLWGWWGVGGKVLIELASQDEGPRRETFQKIPHCRCRLRPLAPSALAARLCGGEK